MLLLVVASCRGTSDYRVALLRLGVQVLPDDVEIPPETRERALSCRVVTHREDAILRPDRAGYLITAVAVGEEDYVVGRREIESALEAWAGGAIARIRVERNRHRASNPNEAWDVELALPPAR